MIETQKSRITCKTTAELPGFKQIKLHFIAIFFLTVIITFALNKLAIEMTDLKMKQTFFTFQITCCVWSLFLWHFFFFYLNTLNIKKTFIGSVLCRILDLTSHHYPNNNKQYKISVQSSVHLSQNPIHSLINIFKKKSSKKQNFTFHLKSSHAANRLCVSLSLHS